VSALLRVILPILSEPSAVHLRPSEFVPSASDRTRGSWGPTGAPASSALLCGRRCGSAGPARSCSLLSKACRSSCSCRAPSPACSTACSRSRCRPRSCQGPCRHSRPCLRCRKAGKSSGNSPWATASGTRRCSRTPPKPHSSLGSGRRTGPPPEGAMARAPAPARARRHCRARLCSRRRGMAPGAQGRREPQPGNSFFD